MIELAAEAGLLAVGITVVAAVGWASYLSIRSAARGPAWALGHLRSARPVTLATMVVGLVAAATITPIWVGLSILYVGLAIWVLLVLLRRSLQRLAEAGGMELLPLERRLAIVARARRLFGLTGAVLVVIGAAGMATGGGVVGWIAAALGVTLAVTATLIAAEKDLGGADAR